MVIEQSTSDRNIFVPGWPWTPRIYETGLPGVAANWWDPNNDIVCANIWAYRAINSVGTPWPGGPTVYADTLVNLVNPGVNDLVEGNGAVPWAQATGWGFVAAAGKWFDTNIIPVNDQSWTMLAQHVNCTTHPSIAGFGVPPAGPYFYLQPNFGPGVQASYGNGGIAGFAPSLPTGNLGVAGPTGYRNGLPEVAIPAQGGVFDRDIAVGGFRWNVVICTTVVLESVVVYDCTLTDPQMLDVATAMSQL